MLAHVATNNWVRNATSSAYERPLGRTELAFYWDGKFNGTADLLRYAIVDAQSPALRTQLFSADNVTRTWVALKHQYPLLGSQVAARQHEEEVVFIVSEERLNFCAPEEISFRSTSTQMSLSSMGEVEAFMDTILDGTHLLSDELLGRVFIFTPTDQDNRVCVLMHVAHCIADGTANTTLLRSFLDILSSEPGAVQWDLEERLALAIASERLMGDIRVISTRQKWHYAMGLTLASIRMKKKKGGHTLPRKLTPLTRVTPAQSGYLSSTFSREVSGHILRACRGNNVTFGSVYPVLGQVALTRVLCRRYIRGDMDGDEWEYRRREPMSTGGPLNLRPFLNKQWFEQGGSASISLCMGFLFRTLPFMPLGSCFDLAPGDSLPEFQDLLSPARFWLRSNSITQQVRALLRHPLFPYILVLDRAERLKGVAGDWQKRCDGQAEDNHEVISCVEQGQKYGPVMSHGGSSFGNTDVLIPHDYPLSQSQLTSQAPVLHIYATGTRLHCRPAELYLGASTFGQQLSFFVFWDKNVFDSETVEEWLGEVRRAAEFYLGSTNHTER